MPRSLSRDRARRRSPARARSRSSPGRGRQRRASRVFAAASLTEAFPQLPKAPRYSFAGSDQLAAQIQLGARADVFAAASPKYPDLLYQKGLCEKPVPFATNTLIVIVPKSNPAGIHCVQDLTKPGVKIVIADQVGARRLLHATVLKNLGITDAVLKNVVSAGDRREVASSPRSRSARRTPASST